MDLKTQGNMASDAYNDHSFVYEAAGLSAKQQAPLQQGWGLGLDEFLPSSQESSATAYSSPPQPLTPYAGTDRRPLPPSPVKMASLQPPQPQPLQQSAAEVRISRMHMQRHACMLVLSHLVLVWQHVEYHAVSCELRSVPLHRRLASQGGS